MSVTYALRRSVLIDRLEAAWTSGRLILSLTQYATLLSVLFPEDFDADDVDFAERALDALVFLPIAADASAAHARARAEAAAAHRRQVGAAAARRRRQERQAAAAEIATTPMAHVEM